MRLAYTEHGEGPPLVYTRGWISHIDLFWDDPDFRAYFDALASCHRVIRLDMRGNGLSDRAVEGRLSIDELVLDLEALFEKLDLHDAVLYATCYGGPIAIRYLANDSSRVSHLILDGTYANGPALGTPATRQSILSAVDLFASQPRAGHAILSVFTRPAGANENDDKLRRSRQSITPDVAKTLYELSFDWDVTAELDAITIPTLVLHRKQSQVVPYRLGQDLASRLPLAEFVGLDGADHNPWEGDALPPLQAIARFLERPVDRPFRRRVHLRPVVILFTDIVSSTSNTVRLGDRGAQEVVRAHNTIVHRGLEDHGGKRVKSTGDGVMAEFGSVSQALLAAATIQRELDAHSTDNPDAALRVRMGVDAGEVLPEYDDLHGIVVNTAARICERAHGGEVLVSSVVRDLARGKGFAFTDAGPFDLRGLDEPTRLFRLELDPD